MSKEGSDCGAKPSDLLYQLEHILESDPLIDEIGFIHPSQFTTLSQGIDVPVSSSIETILQFDEINKLTVPESSPSDAIFWSRYHKLGISVNVLQQLYGAAKHAFIDSLERYKTQRTSGNASSSFSILENEVMKHSKALLILSCDFGTAWNARKLVASKKKCLSIFLDELLLSALVLSYSPKSEHAWNHRRWVIKMIAGNSSILQDIVEKESELVKKIAEKSKMNYRAWNHRCWLVSYMSGGQVWREFNNLKDWAGLHVADNSCFHYRTRLILRMHEDALSETELYQVWKEELEWDEILIKRYIGREALWLHRRFLSVFWIKYLAPSGSSHHFNHKKCPINNVDIYIDNELRLFHSCRTIPDNDFEDYHAQKMLSATYIMWLIKHMNEYLGVSVGLKNKLQAEELKMLLNDVSPSVIFESIRENVSPKKS